MIIGPYLFYIKKFITQFKTTEKNDRSPKKNDDLRLCRVSAVKKKPALERLSLTFTANGKRQTFAVCLQLSVQ